MSSYQEMMAVALSEIAESVEVAQAAAQANAVEAARESLATLIELDQLSAEARGAVYSALSRLTDLEEAA